MARWAGARYTCLVTGCGGAREPVPLHSDVDGDEILGFLCLLKVALDISFSLDQGKEFV